MKNSVIATAALVAAAAAQSIGSAVVVNKCQYDVYLYNVPAADGGYTEDDKILSTDDTYEQQWTELTNLQGWSMKLSNSTSLNYILQYEYTFLDDGTIWYDLSEVNGNPWDGNWEITSDSSTCVPKQQAYRYATDDAYGEQACPQDATITVTLCSGDSDDDTAASSASSSVAAESTSAASTTESAPTSIPASTTSEPNPTTLETSTITSEPATTGYHVVTVTHVATTTAWTHQWGGRDAHSHQHHAARHPHARN
ncbi:hypothetical protein BDV97DRAFT_372596 [Delphinella strobiligena]|nr:hypothetical protein BDV97DRAFT_372596 [Delphinella strobiligena]